MLCHAATGAVRAPTRPPSARPVPTMPGVRRYALTVPVRAHTGARPLARHHATGVPGAVWCGAVWCEAERRGRDDAGGMMREGCRLPSLSHFFLLTLTAPANVSSPLTLTAPANANACEVQAITVCAPANACGLQAITEAGRVSVHANADHPGGGAHLPPPNPREKKSSTPSTTQCAEFVPTCNSVLAPWSELGLNLGRVEGCICR